MSNINTPIKARVCFLCKQYSLIYPDNPSNLEFIKTFDAWHDKHPLQTINVNEIDNSYTLISEKGREKALSEIITENKEEESKFRVVEVPYKIMKEYLKNKKRGIIKNV